MSNKLNIFNSLPQYPSDDEEEVRGGKKTTQGGKTSKRFLFSQNPLNPF